MQLKRFDSIEVDSSKCMVIDVMQNNGLAESCMVLFDGDKAMMGEIVWNGYEWGVSHQLDLFGYPNVDLEFFEKLIEGKKVSLDEKIAELESQIEKVRSELESWGRFKGGEDNANMAKRFLISLEEQRSQLLSQRD